MTPERNQQTRVVLSWLREDQHENAERVLALALDEVDATQQRRSWWPAWRYSNMSNTFRIAAVAAAVFVVAVAGYQLLPRSSGSGAGGSPAVAPSPTPSLLARGTFKAKGSDVVLDATGAGSSASGTMTVSSTDFSFTVELQCTRNTDDDLLWIAGDVTESSFIQYAPEGTRTGIVLQPGSPVQAVFIFQMNDPRAATCQAFVDDLIALGARGDVLGGLDPIEGRVELAP